MTEGVALISAIGGIAAALLAGLATVFTSRTHKQIRSPNGVTTGEMIARMETYVHDMRHEWKNDLQAHEARDFKAFDRIEEALRDLRKEMHP